MNKFNNKTIEQNENAHFSIFIMFLSYAHCMGTLAMVGFTSMPLG
jgi:hypothetical protein